LRAAAAFFVLFEHGRNFLFVDFPQITLHRRLLAPLYLLTSAGHQAVVVFFVLSGYFIGGTVLRGLDRNQWDWIGYLLRRMVRLWVVLLPALLLTVLWDRLGIQLGHGPGLYSGHGPSNQLGNVFTALTPQLFFGNLFFQQSVTMSTFGSNGALWSLANEFWYYILFPLGAVALWRTQALRRRLLCAVLFIACAWFVRNALLSSFPIWLAGVVLFKAPPPSFTPLVGKLIRVVAPIVYLPVFLISGKLRLFSDIHRDYLLAVITVIFLWSLLSAKQPYVPQAFSVRISREMARFSYTLYALHVPILVFLTSLAVGDSRWIPTPRTLLTAFGILLVITLYAWVVAFLTEFRTDAVRAKLEKLFGVASIPHSLSTNPLDILPDT
jgi:peptidoglycan/LPS O-acetylase OafA/YrhL